MSRSVVVRALRWLFALSLLGALLALPGRAQAKDDDDLAPKHISLNIDEDKAKPIGDKGDAGKNRVTSNGISYHGGPVMLGPTNAYIIWYGNWSGNTATSIIPNFLSAIGGSPYFNINTTYYDGNKVKVTNAVNLAGQTTDTYTFGKVLTDSNVRSVVSNAITSGRLPNDVHGVYFVLTSGDVGESSGFLTQYCGWHTHGSISGSDIKYSFVGDASAKLSACAAQTASSPNNNVAADAMLSVIAHELEEAVTDPDLNAWYDSRGYENADKCAWTFGATSTATNGSKYNMTLPGGGQYLIQRNWVNAGGGYCALSY